MRKGYGEQRQASQTRRHCQALTALLAPQACMLHADGELVLVGYGSTRVLATCRTAHFSPALLSLRLSTSPSSPADRTAEQSQQRPPACALDSAY